MRIIHLIDQRALEAGPGHLAMMLDMVGQLRQFDHHLVALGGKPIARMLSQCGATDVTLIEGPVWLAGRKLGRTLPSPAEDAVVHAWSATAPSVAGRLTENRSLVCTLGHEPLSRELADALGKCRNVASRFHLVRHGLVPDGPSPQCRDSLSITPLAPGLSDRPIDRQQRQAMRQGWAVEDGEILVLGVAGDGPCDAMANLWVAGLAGESGRPVRLLISPDAQDLPRARRLARSMGRASRLIVDARAARPWEVGPACEVGLVIAGTAGSGGATFDPPPWRRRRPAGHLPELWAMRCGLPLLVEQAPETLGHGPHQPHSSADPPNSANPAAHAPPVTRFAHASPRDAARRLIELIDQPDRRQQLAANARQWVAQQFPPQTFARAYESLYQGESL